MKRDGTRDFHEARWDEPILMELGEPGQRALLLEEIEPQVAQAAGAPDDLVPQGYLRREAPELPELGQMQLLRHYLRLSQETIGADLNIDIGLGTCTMKYNPKVHESFVRDPRFSELHPYQDPSTTQGILQVLYETEQYLKAISGMDRFSLNPAGGSQGIFSNVAIIRAYHEARGEGAQRDEIITTILSHPGNAGTAAALRRAHHGVPQHAHDDEDDEIRHKAQPPGCLPRGRVVVLGENAFGLLLLHEIVEIVVEDAEAAALVGVFRLSLVGGAQLHGEIAVGVDGEGFDLLRLKKLDDFRIDERFLCGVSRHGIDRAEQQHEDQYEKADLTGLVGGGSVVQKLSLPFLPSHRTARTIYKSEIYFSYTSGLRTPMNGRLRYFSA